MTDEQFDALETLLRLRYPQAGVIRAHMVEGTPVPEAARAAGVSYKAAHAAVQRAKVGLELAKVAAGTKKA